MLKQRGLTVQMCMESHKQYSAQLQSICIQVAEY